MVKREQLLFFATVNLLIVGYLISLVWGGNDKAVILMLLFYPALIVVNAITWIVTKSKVFKYTTLGLLLLFVPALIISSWY